ncbi:HAMP domain-containing sensor histidine kinase [Dactylosporangium sp. AC04546]|uniref:HAMP domain-containing sensor histidine kinase n=1 Tax=Dactylosporangium sp. AC04546 TaxID=2862460 RepID=UPI001EDF3D72|nr:HAMP domain-containing sensor histidine kinase [Dactylosporangium sp. AC04546]WVK83773.1 HAMP domain-containing sensor histidine kinase [Dactylosporangium sp. AC04546]
MKKIMDLLPRPLDPVRSIKLKLAILLFASALAGLLVFRIGIGWMPPTTSAMALTVGLLTSQILAHGVTSPLREMTAAARAMARGDYKVRVRSTSRDEVGQLAAAFNQMAGELAAADQQRRELIANVSHELRTPISAVQAMLENIVDGVAEPDPATLRTALAQTERLGRLVTELLDISRLDAGVVPLDRETFRMDDLLHEVVAEAEVKATATGSKVDYLTCSFPEDALVSADRARLHHVLTNLVDNATRHSPEGGTVTIIGRRDGQHVMIEVADEGPGIPHHERERVFERFTRGARPSGGGTGLGLAIAQWLTQLHDGTIAVIEQPDGNPGARIRVTLPV